MKWRTAISTHKDGELHIRGEALRTLVEKHTFSEVIFLLLGGRMPSKAETAMLDMLLVSCAEHGVEAPSAFSARVSASVGNQLNAALAAGILATGEWHGGAIERAAKHLQSSETPANIVSSLRARGERLPGFGHKIYKDKDPRAEMLLAEAVKLGISKNGVERVRALESELAAQSGKHLPVNIDGAMAAIISDLGFDWRLGNAFFLLGRTPGIIAHIYEETVNEKPYRRIDESDVTYTGL
ncbi:MAG: citryl-CoA lyase [Minisyncoccia bacterium]